MDTIIDIDKVYIKAIRHHFNIGRVKEAIKLLEIYRTTYTSRRQ